MIKNNEIAETIEVCHEFAACLMKWDRRKGTDERGHAGQEAPAKRQRTADHPALHPTEQLEQDGLSS